MPIAAAVQMSSTGNVEENLTQAEQLIKEASARGARLVVLPEMFPLLGCQSAEKITHQEKPGSGKIQDFLSQIAAKHQVWVVGGTIPLLGKISGKTRASCLIFDSNGQQKARYDKIHMFDAHLSAQEKYCESAVTEPGEHIVVLETPVGKLGVCVCFDIRFPTIFMEFNKQGVEVIAVPAAFAVKTGQAHWEVLLRCRALDTLSYVVGAGQCGEHPNGRKTYGHSMIVNPWGEIVTERKEDKPGVIWTEIDLGMVSEARKRLPVIG